MTVATLRSTSGHSGEGRGQAGEQAPSRRPGHLAPGLSTAVGTNVTYRLGKLARHGVLGGVWLDCGCAEGGYSRALARMGAERVVGIDVETTRVSSARAMGSPAMVRPTYCCASAEELPFADESFDGVFLNEVFEHVADESRTLAEIRRVLRPGGVLALMSPNRWFPFEGHGMRLGGWELGFPVPIVPWVPMKLVRPFMHARNYWPGELRNLVSAAGFEIISTSSVFPVFEVYAWLPKRVIRAYQRALPTIERVPVLRRFGVSTCVLARRPRSDPRRALSNAAAGRRERGPSALVRGMLRGIFSAFISLSRTVNHHYWCNRARSRLSF
ncbi:MAG TPA: class I SAM-dependent methyltransferase [Chloroflexota bacterium]|nr:class I SAM-dependent methyltransferase [Chloroflexota bacterium]